MSTQPIIKEEMYETDLEQLLSIWPLLRIHLQTFCQVILEHVRQRLGIIDRGRSIRRDQVKRLERILVQIWRLAFDHF